MSQEIQEVTSIIQIDIASTLIFLLLILPSSSSSSLLIALSQTYIPRNVRGRWNPVISSKSPKSLWRHHPRAFSGSRQGGLLNVWQINKQINKYANVLIAMHVVVYVWKAMRWGVPICYINKSSQKNDDCLPLKKSILITIMTISGCVAHVASICCINTPRARSSRLAGSVCICVCMMYMYLCEFPTSRDLACTQLPFFLLPKNDF